jgi:hydroxypyruvate isomerase
MPPLAANISLLFTQWPFIDRLAAARDHGFSAVECQFPYGHDADLIARKAAAANVEFVLFNAPPGNWLSGERGLAALPGREEEFAQGIDTAIHYARALGTRQIHIMAGIADPANRGHSTRYIHALRHACDALAEYGLSVLIEPINSFDMPGYFLGGFDQAGAAIDAVRRDNLGLQFDLYHCQRMHGAVLPSLERHFARVRHIQIAGTPLRHEPDVGDLPVGPIFATLDSLGYTGWIGCEYNPAGDTGEGLAWITAYRQPR